MKKKFLFFSLLLIAFIVQAQETSEIYKRAKVHYNGQAGFERLHQLDISLEHGVHKRGHFITTVFSESEIELIKSAGFEVEVLIEDAKAYFLAQNRNYTQEFRNPSCSNLGNTDYSTPANFNLGSMGGYLTYQEVLDEFDQMVALYPNIISQPTNISGPSGDFLTEGQPDTSVTPSIGGNGIKWLKISDNPNVDENEAQILYTSIHHAREPASLMQLIFYMWYLLENYDTNPEVKAIVDNTELYFVPVVNPDGYLYNEVTDPNGGGFWRKNRKNGNGTDNNRNYNYFINGNPNNGSWGGPGASSNPNSEVYHGTAPFSEVENQAMKQFVEDHEFVMAFNNHTSGQLLYYPFSYGDVPTPDEDLFIAVSAELTSRNGYFPLRDFPFSGDSDDFMYGTVGTHNKIFSFTPEIGQQFWPPQNEIVPISKNMMYLNLTAARMATNFAKVTETSSIYSGNQETATATFTLRNLGITGNGNFTVSINPISSNIIATGAPVSFNSVPLLTEENGSIPYTLAGGTTAGDEIEFELVVNNGMYDAKIPVTKRFGALSPVLEDPGNSVTTNFNNNGWTTTNTTFVSPPNSITDSNGNYTSNTNKTITLSDEINLTNANGATVSFFARWDIENDFDYVQFEVSTNGGNSWEPQCGIYTNSGSTNASQPTNEPLYDGLQTDWIKEEIDLSNYLGQSILVRFQLVTDGAENRDGFYFDDLKINIVEDATLNVTDIFASQFTIYPNPVLDNLTVKTDLDNYNLQIYSLQGQLLQELQNVNGTQTINYNAFASGIYLMKITSENNSKTFKIIKR